MDSLDKVEEAVGVSAEVVGRAVEAVKAVGTVGVGGLIGFFPLIFKWHVGRNKRCAR